MQMKSIALIKTISFNFEHAVLIFVVFQEIILTTCFIDVECCCFLFISVYMCFEERANFEQCKFREVEFERCSNASFCFRYHYFSQDDLGIIGQNFEYFLQQSSDYFPTCEAPHKAEGQISSLKCPCCGENLVISHEIHCALISREERTRISNAVLSINRHCSTYHEEVLLWIEVESTYLLEDKVSVMFLSQSLICKASIKTPIINKDIQGHPRTSKDIQETIHCARSSTLQTRLVLYS
jgi:hypothetical protein